jgi:hypothetical protein
VEAEAEEGEEEESEAVIGRCEMESEVACCMRRSWFAYKLMSTNM